MRFLFYFRKTKSSLIVFFIPVTILPKKSLIAVNALPIPVFIFSQMALQSIPNRFTFAETCNSDGSFSVCVSNTVKRPMSRVESTKIGLRTCERILETMGGQFRTVTEDGKFAAELILPAEET